jgi:hypothetical protein
VLLIPERPLRRSVREHEGEPGAPAGLPA